MSRRELIVGGGGLLAVAAARRAGAQEPPAVPAEAPTLPAVLSTWSHGGPANEAAWAVLAAGGSALDAVEAGVRVSEADPKVRSVGYGGLPNEEGVVQLDACIMRGSDRNAGAVAGLERVKHPISVARRVMEKTRHLLLVGDGARRFAVAQGFPEEDLLTPESKATWEKWKAEQAAKSGGGAPGKEPPDAHDTIGMVAVDARGDVAAACTTSGLAWKLPGRVGDSPLVGHGLYADSRVGGAASTGVGEEVIRVCGSFVVVEEMRRGRTPQEACEEACRRILERTAGKPAGQVAFIALRKDGVTGAACLREGFVYHLRTAAGNPQRPGTVVRG
ncbi:MAG: N(4)-(beta-N-acetylglucosaminyl)-L-asparaginase [Planctomycetales bacterium]|nr:N(4)-(beta-N-acetylglucosaminyl)-L-asparaginase [Planctomycetales bacterium]